MKKMFLLLSTFLLLAACGGGGDGGNPVPIPPGSVVSGTASEGELITGKAVRLKDANGKSAEETKTDAVTGVYSINITGLTAPFMVTVTGKNGTYISLAQNAGTTNINPITTMVLALAAGVSDAATLFTNLTPAQIVTITNNYGAKSALVAAALQSVLLPGVKVEDYFTGTIKAGSGMDALFDKFQIVVDPVSGITIKSKDDGVSIVLNISAATIAANSNQPLPAVAASPTSASPTSSSTSSPSSSSSSSSQPSSSSGGGTISITWTPPAANGSISVAW